MKIESSRFGEMNIDDADLIEFPRGLVGLPQAKQFVLLRKTPASPVGWLQSTTLPDFAVPVVSVEALATEIPLADMVDAVAKAGIDADIDQCAVMAVLCVPGINTPATVNLLAPIIVNATTRQGAQVILEGSQFTTHEPFVLARKPDKQAQDHAPAPAVAAGTGEAFVAASP